MSSSTEAKKTEQTRGQQKSIIPKYFRGKLPDARENLGDDPVAHLRLFHPAGHAYTDFYVLGGYEDGDEYIMLVWSNGEVGYQPLSHLELGSYRGLRFERDTAFTPVTVATLERDVPHEY